SKMPPDEAIEELVTKIFNYDLCSSNATEVTEVICHSKRVLTDFCSKFNYKVNTKVKEFKEIRRS
ncbi:11066_t:CDS:1, partial [Funneliformis caledonium]